LVIADNDPIFRDGVRRLLEAEDGCKVIGEASDGAEAVKLAHQLKPDILLLDLDMPKHPGMPKYSGLVDALLELNVFVNATPVPVILLAAAEKKSQIVEALQLGARGVVLKDSAGQQLLKAIQTVIAGEYWVGCESVSNLVQHLRTLMQSSQLGLTPRELGIVSAVVAGYTNNEIAEYFKISAHTVKLYLFRMFDKWGVSTRLELAQFWAERLRGPEDDSSNRG